MMLTFEFKWSVKLPIWMLLTTKGQTNNSTESNNWCGVSVGVSVDVGGFLTLQVQFEDFSDANTLFCPGTDNLQHMVIH